MRTADTALSIERDSIRRKQVRILLLSKLGDFSRGSEREICASDTVHLHLQSVSSFDPICTGRELNKEGKDMLAMVAIRMLLKFSIDS